MSCLVCKRGPYSDTPQGTLQPRAPDPSSEAPVWAIIFPIKMRKENLSWSPSVYMFFSMVPKSVPSQALLFSIWPNDFHEQITSNLGKQCLWEALNNMRFVLLPLLTPPGPFTECWGRNGFLFSWTSLFCWVCTPSYLPQLPRTHWLPSLCLEGQLMPKVNTEEMRDGRALSAALWAEVRGSQLVTLYCELDR